MDDVLEQIAGRELEIKNVVSAMFAPANDTNWGTQVSFHTSKAIERLKIKNILYMDYDGEED